MHFSHTMTAQALLLLLLPMLLLLLQSINTRRA
jgi:hypothetical protein